MRKIEQEMVNAVNYKTTFSKSNTHVAYCEGTSTLSVGLHGNVIYTHNYLTGKRRFTLAGWNTSTTRSRLRALGIPVHVKQGVAYYLGASITSTQWVEIQ